MWQGIANQLNTLPEKDLEHFIRDVFLSYEHNETVYLFAYRQMGQNICCFKCISNALAYCLSPEFLSAKEYTTDMLIDVWKICYEFRFQKEEQWDSQLDEYKNLNYFRDTPTGFPLEYRKSVSKDGLEELMDYIEQNGKTTGAALVKNELMKGRCDKKQLRQKIKNALNDSDTINYKNINRKRQEIKEGDNIESYFFIAPKASNVGRLVQVELDKLNRCINNPMKSQEEKRDSIIEFAHAIAYIHPFPDGNLRAIRAFIFGLFVKIGCMPPMNYQPFRYLWYSTAEIIAEHEEDVGLANAFLERANEKSTQDNKKLFSLCDNIISDERKCGSINVEKNQLRKSWQVEQLAEVYYGKEDFLASDVSVGYKCAIERKPDVQSELYISKLKGFYSGLIRPFKSAIDRLAKTKVLGRGDSDYTVSHSRVVHYSSQERKQYQDRRLEWVYKQQDIYWNDPKKLEAEVLRPITENKDNGDHKLFNTIWNSALYFSELRWVSAIFDQLARIPDLLSSKSSTRIPLSNSYYMDKVWEMRVANEQFIKHQEVKEKVLEWGQRRNSVPTDADKKAVLDWIRAATIKVEKGDSGSYRMLPTEKEKGFILKYLGAAKRGVKFFKGKQKNYQKCFLDLIAGITLPNNREANICNKLQ